MTERCLAALDYVDLQCKQVHRKHYKNRSLGDLESKYRYHPPKSATTIISTLVDLDFPETRAINDITANSIISEQTKQIKNTYKRATRTVSSAPPAGRSKPVISPRSTPLSPGRPDRKRWIHDSNDNTHGVNTTRLRPFTAGEVQAASRRTSALHRTKMPRSKSADADTGRFMTIKMKRDGSAKTSASFHSVTRNIRSKWEAEDKTMKKSVVKGRKVETFDPNSAKWYTFAGGTEKPHSAGVVDAFTGKQIVYKIEGGIGDRVAHQLKLGNKLRIGINGDLQTNNFKVKTWNPAESNVVPGNDEQPFRSKLAERKVKSAPPPPTVTEIIPLCWSDEVNKPFIKVVEPTIPTPKPPKPDLCERHPVIFEKLIKDEDVKPRTDIRPDTYRVRQRVKNKLNIDGTSSLSNRITVVTVDQFDDDQESLSSRDYNEILNEKLHAESIPVPETEKEVELSDIKSSSTSGSVKEEKKGIENLRSASRESFTSSVGLEKPMTPQASIVSNVVSDNTFMTTGVNPLKPQSGERSKSSTPRSAVGSITKVHPLSNKAGLAKPGQLHRSGVTSVSNGHKDGETSFIRIAQGIGIPDVNPSTDLNNDMISASSHHNAKIITKVSETNKVNEKRSRYIDNGEGINLKGKQMQVLRSEGSGENGSRRSSPGSSIVSSNGNLTVHPHQHKSANGEIHVCTCTPEAKRVMARLISHPPPPSPNPPPGSVRDDQTEDDTRQYIHIPTAGMLIAESDLQSMSDLEMYSSAVSFDDQNPHMPSRSHLKDNDKEGYVTLENLAKANMKIEDHLQLVAEDTKHVASEILGSESDHAISHVEAVNQNGIETANPNDVDLTENQKCPEEIVLQKSVRFADETKSDITVSKGTAALIRSVTYDDDDVSLTSSKNPTEELNELRSQIKTDLQQTQDTVQQDIQDLYLKQHGT
ncbi:uncharacterized protein LOC100376789 [Saccoglossus kowalevskii]|uniref:Uncharacterized protein LOC100376789 n=1 Tax=Saccoglossus kowalevskii TaxID=10224 RepID=A0ABM0GWX9_SACKO|nr:PREDICTED: uncharacterized protein LOC100376789 [Saccoglossus kowalevskii]